MSFKKATLEQSRLRLAIYGPSGAGKTYTALRIATGIGGPIAVIDTERRTARKYSRTFDFDVNELDTRTIDAYVQAIQEAKGYNVLVIDSMSHAWQELLEEIDRLASTKFQGNTWSAWSKGTPKQRKFIDAILNFDGHVIATIRSKTDWDQVKDERTGKTKPVRVGLAPEQGKGIEYEFDMLMNITADHTATVEKDRTGKFQDAIIDRPGEDFGRDLIAWLMDAPPAERQTPVAPEMMTLNSEAAQDSLDDEMRMDADGDRKQTAQPKPPASTFDALLAQVAAEKNTTVDKLHKAIQFSQCGIDPNISKDALITWLNAYGDARRQDKTPQEAGAIADDETMKAIDLGAV
jgi:hypothetical protein